MLQPDVTPVSSFAGEKFGFSSMFFGPSTNKSSLLIWPTHHIHDIAKHNIASIMQDSLIHTHNNLYSYVWRTTKRVILKLLVGLNEPLKINKILFQN